MSDRRTFLKSALVGTLLVSAESQAKTSTGTPAPKQWISLIDLDRCNGCPGLAVPACVSACRQKNQKRFPEPQKPLKPYWPQKTFEDFSSQRERADRLTPYNWLYVEKIVLNDGREIFAPRRCMHCFDAPCRKICPFGAIDRTVQGAIKIDPKVCFGGAKCRDVCPWGIPQRQAGVGLYLDVAPTFAGGGVMYKCDFCADRLRDGQTPACAQSCPQKAISFLPLEQALITVRQMAANRYLYGVNENGGTATWYISSVPFEELNKAIVENQKPIEKAGRPAFQAVAPQLKESSSWAIATLAAPLAAAATAYLIARRKKSQKKEDK